MKVKGTVFNYTSIIYDFFSIWLTGKLLINFEVLVFQKMPMMRRKEKLLL